MPGGSSGGQTATTSQNTSMNSNTSGNSSVSPFGPFNNFITGSRDANGNLDGATPGILPSLDNAFKNSAFTPQMQAATDAHTGDIQNDQGINALVHNTGIGLLEGNQDPHITPAGPIAGAPTINPQAPTPVSARANQGSLDPTNALGGFLNSSSTNPFVQQEKDALTGQATRNLMNNIMPQIRSSAEASGMYGSDREGIAQGTAISNMNTDLAPALTQLDSAAYENDQNRALTAATGLNDQATNMAMGNAGMNLAGQTTNASNALNSQEFNTGTNLANNAQGMQASGMDTANRLAGTNVAGSSAALGDQSYQDLINSLQAPGNAGWNNLAKYASIFQPMMGMYPSTSSTGQTSGTSSMTGTQFIPQTSNPAGTAIGGALGLGSLAGNLFGSGGAFPGALGGLFGSGGGAGAAGLGDMSAFAAGVPMLAASDRTLKTDIKRQGTDEETGLPLYSYRYKDDPKTYPKVVGPMAQDVEELYPELVRTIGGKKAVSLNFGPMARAFGGTNA